MTLKNVPILVSSKLPNVHYNWRSRGIELYGPEPLSNFSIFIWFISQKELCLLGRIICGVVGSCTYLMLTFPSEMSRSPSPDHLSLSAGLWKSETFPVKAIMLLVQHPISKPEVLIINSSPKCWETHWVTSPHAASKMCCLIGGLTKYFVPK